jgi:hypothetical protein
MRVSASFQAILSEATCPRWVETFAVPAGGLDNSRWLAPNPSKPRSAPYHRNPVHAWILDARPASPDRRAVRQASRKIWRLLETSGAVPKFASEIDPSTGLTPLMRACESRWTWTYLRAMFESPAFPGIDVDVRSRPRCGTVLHHAFFHTDLFPTPPQLAALRDFSPCWIAIARRMTSASLNAADAGGDTILSLALRCGLFEVAGVLVDERGEQLDLFEADASGLDPYGLATAMLAETAPARPEPRAPLAQRHPWEFVLAGSNEHLALVALRARLLLLTSDRRRLVERALQRWLPPPLAGLVLDSLHRDPSAPSPAA